MNTPEFVMPGRPNRKLLMLVAEIQKLRAQGYSVADIHRTLTARGMVVGYSSVRRECKKLTDQERAASGLVHNLPPVRAAPMTPNAAPSPAGAVAGTPAVTGAAEAKTAGGASKSFTDEFFDTHRPRNPILDKLDRMEKKP